MTPKKLLCCVPSLQRSSAHVSGDSIPKNNFVDGFAGVEEIYTARTPIVKLEDKLRLAREETRDSFIFSGFHVDMSVGNHLGVLKAEYLRYFVDFDSR